MKCVIWEYVNLLLAHWDVFIFRCKKSGSLIKSHGSENSVWSQEVNTAVIIIFIIITIIITTIITVVINICINLWASILSDLWQPLQQEQNCDKWTAVECFFSSNWTFHPKYQVHKDGSLVKQYHYQFYIAVSKYQCPLLPEGNSGYMLYYGNGQGGLNGAKPSIFTYRVNYCMVC